MTAIGMRHLLSTLVLCFVALYAQAQTIEVRYFHGKQRCVTCRSIEKCAQEVLAESFAQQVQDKQIKMRVIDFSTAEGKKVATDHKVSYSSLIVASIDKDGKEKRTDLTRMGFQYAKNKPEEFKRLLKAEIDKLCN